MKEDLVIIINEDDINESLIADILDKVLDYQDRMFLKRLLQNLRMKEFD